MRSLTLLMPPWAQQLCERLQRQQAHHAHVAVQLGQFHGGRQAGQSAADDHHAWSLTENQTVA